MDRLTQEAPQAFRGRMFQRNNSLPKETKILVLKTGLAGKNFHIESKMEQEALDNIKPGTELLLFREPENEFDKWAIAVYLTEEDKIGYVSRYKNETIARLMDVGKKFIAIVDDPNEDEEIKEIVEKRKIQNSYAPTEDMSIPFSIYLIQTD